MRLLLTLALAAASTTAALAEPPDAEDVVVQLTDGTRLLGRIVGEQGSELEIATPSGATVRVPRSAVESIRPRSEASASRGDAGVPDPNDSRLFFAPTGRPLRRGSGQVSNHLIFFPGVSYGVTDNVTIMGGVSTVPGLALDEQLFYFAPKIGARLSERFALSAGYLFARVAEEGFRNGAGIGFAVATIGGSGRSLTAGLGLAHSDGDSSPILMLGGEARLGRRVFLLSENWLILGGDVRLSEQPFSLGVRLCGENLSVDFGMIVVGELIEDGFPMPWLSASYRFGSSAARPASARRAASR